MVNVKKDTVNRFLCKAVSVYAIVLVMLNALRIFDNNFWGDEAFTIRLSKMDFVSMLQATAEDVHPPLYYWIVQLACRLLGYSGEVYHFVSFVPYVLIIIVAMTMIRKRFGLSASVVLVTLSSLLDTSISYNVEVRMYSWGALFLLMSFLELYEILTVNRKKDYVLFVLFSLAGAYTHYYCLVSVAFFYIVLIGVACIRRKEYFVKTAVSCVATVALYLPWFIVLLATFQRTMGDFWMTGIPYLKDCFGFLFSGSLQYILFVVMLVSVAAAIRYKREDQAWILWLLAGLGSIFGTIAVGNLISRIFRPVFIVRYLYPVAIIAWTVLAVGISCCKKKYLYAAVLTAALLFTGIPKYAEISRSEKAQDELLQETLEATKQAVGAGNTIWTDLQYIDWTVADYYYPEAEHALIDMTDIPMLKEDRTYWLMTQTQISPEITEQLTKQGYSPVVIVEQGTLGTNPVRVYRLEKMQ